MSPDTISDCCCEEYKAAYEFMEAAARAANEVDVAREAVDIQEETLNIRNIIKPDTFKVGTAAAAAVAKVLTGGFSGAVIDAAKQVVEQLAGVISEDDLAKRSDVNAWRELLNRAHDLKNKLDNLDAALGKCRDLFENLLKCTAKYEPKTISLKLTWSEDNRVHYHSAESWGCGEWRVGHKEASCKCQAQLERKAPSLTDTFGPWFEYFRKSPKIGKVRDLVCTYEGEAQTYIMVDKAEPFIFPADALYQIHDFKTEMQGGPVAIRFYIVWSRFRPCEPLKFNVIFSGEEKLHVTCNWGPNRLSRIDDLVLEANYSISHVTGGGIPHSWRKLPLISDPIRRFPHRWTQKLEKVDEYPLAVKIYTLEINVESRS